MVDAAPCREARDDRSIAQGPSEGGLAWRDASGHDHRRCAPPVCTPPPDRVAMAHDQLQPESTAVL